MGLERTFTKILEVLVTDIHKIVLQQPDGRKKFKKIGKISRNTKLLERLGSGLDRKMPLAINDFRVFQ